MHSSLALSSYPTAESRVVSKRVLSAEIVPNGKLLP